MGKETNFLQRFMMAIVEADPWAHYVRVENVVCPGTPDVNVVCHGIERWIEAKVETVPKRASTLIHVRFEPEQVPWLEARETAAAGTTFVLLRLDNPRSASTTHVFPGSQARELQNGAPADAFIPLSIPEIIRKIFA